MTPAFDVHPSINILNIFSLESTVSAEPKFHMETSYYGETNGCSNGHGHMIMIIW